MEALKQRMTGNRKAFAFCHLNMPQEPIAFIMVALTDSISASMKEITSGYLEHPADPFLPKCAIFYSITSTARGNPIAFIHF